MIHTSKQWTPPRTPTSPLAPVHLDSSHWHDSPSADTNIWPSLSTRLIRNPPGFPAAPPANRVRRSSWTICSSGRLKAAVLPLPVSAATMTSPPPRMSGMASSCIADNESRALSVAVAVGRINQLRSGSSGLHESGTLPAASYCALEDGGGDAQGLSIE